MSRIPITGPQDRFATLEGVKGETYTGEIIVCEGDGITPVDLTGYVVTFYVWEGDVVKAEKICVTTPEMGDIIISLSTTEMTDLAPLAYHYELWADNGEGQTKLILWGWFWVKGECTY